MQPTVVMLGNSSPMMHVQSADGSRMRVPAQHLNQSVTRVEMWPGFDDPAFVDLTLSTDNDRFLSLIAGSLEAQHRGYAVGLAELEQLLSIHSGSAPAWVTSSDLAFAEAIAAYFKCPVGEPTMLLTFVGRDALHLQHMGTSAQPGAFSYIGLTATTTTPSTLDTTLAGEITTSGGGLLRGIATFAHTTGTNTSTLTKTFTSNGTDVLPVVLAQIGVFNAVTVGTLAYHTALSSTATLSLAGDNVTITETLTAG